jgi:hypothetical protein
MQLTTCAKLLSVNMAHHHTTNINDIQSIAEAAFLSHYVLARIPTRNISLITSLSTSLRLLTTDQPRLTSFHDVHPHLRILHLRHCHLWYESERTTLKMLKSFSLNCISSTQAFTTTVVVFSLSSLHTFLPDSPLVSATTSRLRASALWTKSEPV